MYGAVVRGIGGDRFQYLMGDLKTDLGRPRMLDSELPVAAIEELIASYLTLIEETSGEPFPQDVDTQLWDAIGAVFTSWDNSRAVLDTGACRGSTTAQGPRARCKRWSLGIRALEAARA